MLGRKVVPGRKALRDRGRRAEIAGRAECHHEVPVAVAQGRRHHPDHESCARCDEREIDQLAAALAHVTAREAVAIHHAKGDRGNHDPGRHGVGGDERPVRA
jgi:hypothetical protein